MIRINLIEGSQKRARAPKANADLFGTPSAPPTVKIGVGFAVLSVAAIFGHYTMLQRENNALQQAVANEQREATRLANVQHEFDENNTRKQVLMKRIAIIDDLKNNQSGPSSLMNVMADTVYGAKAVWLTSVHQKGTGVSVEGSALSMDAVANLISQMLVSGYFQSVDLNETFEEPGQSLRSPFNFTLVAQQGPITPPLMMASKTNNGNGAAATPNSAPAAPRPAAATPPAPKPRVQTKS